MTASTDNSNSLLTEPRVMRLLEQGERDGAVSYDLINRLLGDLQIDEVEAEALFDALESRGIEVTDESTTPDSTAASGAEKVPIAPQANPAKPTTRRRRSAPRDPAAPPPPGAERFPFPPQANPAKPPTRRSRHRDLDDVLASLEELMIAL